MAVTVTLFNHTAKLFANKEVTFTTLKVMLLSGYSLNVAHTAVSSISPNEVSGNGWTAGGMLLSNVAVSVVTTNDAMLDADDLSVTATGGDIGPATAAIVLDSTSGKPLAHIDFGGTKQAGVGTPMLFQWNAAGLIGWTY